MSRDDATLLDIDRAIELALAFTEGYTIQMFMDDLKTQSSVIHQLLILGEATKRLSDEFRKVHDDVPWRFISGMRDNLIHGYDVIDLDEVWNVIQNDLPELRDRIQPLIPPPPD